MSNGLAFSGSLGFLSLGEIVQIIGNNGGTGVLRIMSKYAPSPGMIYMAKGDPVDAVNGDLTGLEALFFVVRLDGRRVFLQSGAGRTRKRHQQEPHGTHP